MQALQPPAGTVAANRRAGGRAAGRCPPFTPLRRSGGGGPARGAHSSSSGSTATTATSSSSSSSGSARSRVRVQARQRSGPSGLNVGGHSPTSPSGWDAMRLALQEAGVKVVSPQEVVFAAERDNVVIIDVRPEEDYEKGHIPGALNVAFYRPIQGWDAFKIARRVGYAMFGIMKGTEVNPAFAEEVREVLQDAAGKTVLLYCSQGGVLESTEVYQRGWQTRSLVAAYDLTQDGLTNIHVLKDGYTGWYNSGRDIEVLEYAEEGEEGVTA